MKILLLLLALTLMSCDGTFDPKGNGVTEFETTKYITIHKSGKANVFSREYRFDKLKNTSNLQTHKDFSGELICLSSVGWSELSRWLLLNTDIAIENNVSSLVEQKITKQQVRYLIEQFERSFIQDQNYRRD